MNKKNIWIINHYATNSYFNKAGRHYWFAKNLMDSDRSPTVFCANTRHNQDESIGIEEGRYIVRCIDEIPFVFIRTVQYRNNRVARVMNMMIFYLNLMHSYKKYSAEHGKPDIILASSVHPLALVAGIKIASTLGVPCICEVRDLWPESIVAYGMLSKNNIFVRMLYMMERWIYEKANAIVMTWQGGGDYICEHGWDSKVDMNKVVHISNGVDIEAFDRNSVEHEIDDADVNDSKYRNIVYAGSIRRVNNIELLVDSAKILKSKGVDDIRFLIFGIGDELEELRKKCTDERIDNVIFKGYVEKKFIPSIVTKSYINILHNQSTSLDKYGQSQNKFFEYLAAGRCILQTYTTGYSIVEKAQCGISVKQQTAESVAEAILHLYNNPNECAVMGKNARAVAYEHDFKTLTDKLVKVIEKL